MATTRTEAPTYAEKVDARYPAWLYSIPGLLLILVGFGGLLALTVL